MENTPKKKVSGFHVTIIAILAAIFVLLAIVVVVILPRTTKMIDMVNQELVEMDVIIDDVQDTVENINKIDFNALSDSVDSLKTITSKIANALSIFK